LTTYDSIGFVQKMAQTANAYGMAIGLKNSQDILDSVAPYIQFAVNEECAAYNDCYDYVSFLGSGKPVFHIEYGSAYQAGQFCLRGMSGGNYFSTVIKNLDLGGWVYYCDGSQANTPTINSVGKEAAKEQ